MELRTGSVRRQRRRRTPPADERAPQTSWREKLVGVIVLVVFGVLIPLGLMVEAHTSMRQLNNTLSTLNGYPLVTELARLQPAMKSPDDYRLASQVIAESASQRTMVNKQVMKAAAMHVGFATTSVGLMLILLGIKEQQSASLKFAGLSLDLPQVTTGALVFLAGSALTAAAALMPNAYTTVGSPDFGETVTRPSYVNRPASDAGTPLAVACGMRFAADPVNLALCLKEVKHANEKE